VFGNTEEVMGMWKSKGRVRVHGVKMRMQKAEGWVVGGCTEDNTDA
jgi:hypothetical protein